MESKTKHRLLGVLVVVGIAFLAYPLIQGNTNAPSQASLKAPPFPDQAVQVASTDEAAAIQPQNAPMPPSAQSTAPDAGTQNTAAIQSDDAANQNNANVVNISATDASGTPAATPSVDTSSANPASQADNSTQVDIPVAVNADNTPALDPEAMSPAPAAAETEVNNAEPAKVQMTENKPAEKAAPAKASHHKKVAKSHSKNNPAILSKLTSASAIKANRHQPLDNNGLLQLKKSAWVIQLGSFKEKSNALRMVNKLRASGYRAFIQHVSGHGGSNTRVFVGPEYQQASARIVASELENNLKLHGIVISYKPFSL